jgi:coniferyl-aldehyde dehydrogenase
MDVATETPGFDASTAIADLHRIFDLQKAAYKKVPYTPLDQRRDNLGKLAGMVLGHRNEILAAMEADFVVSPTQFNDLVEVLGIAGRVGHALESLDAWTADDVRPGDPAMLGTGRAFIRMEPKGVICNIAPWNFPFDLTLGPLVEMLAAGNRVVLKPSEHAPACSALLKKMVSETFPEDTVAVVLGGADVSRACTELRWDHLLYTGSPGIGREVAKAAATNLVPVTLELGGKCPVVMADDAIRANDVASMIGGKLIKNGQMCVTADYALVPADRVDDFVALAEAFFADNAADYTSSPACCGIITERHYQRLVTMLEEAQAAGARTVALGGEANPATRQMPLTLVIDPPTNSRIMSEEVFGPILPVVPYETIDDAIAHINAGEKPLGLYVYAHDAAVADKVVNATSSGGVCVNGIGFQAALANMGFGGVGESGTGRHHGIEGFREFSNPRGHLVRGEGDLIDAMNPPYGDVATAIVEGAYAGIPGPDEA